jgi:hypothetical protein
VPKRTVNVPDISVVIGDEVIKPSRVVSNIGATFDNHLHMDKQVADVARGAYFHLRRIGKIRRHLDNDTCKKVINATVTSRLDYHNGLLSGVTDACLRRLQVVQNNAARLITGTRKYDHIRPVLRSLHWLPVRKRVSFKLLTLVQKGLHDTNSPQYIKDMLTIYQPGRSLRSSRDHWILHVPRVTRMYGSNAFPVLGATLWNALPLTMRLPMSSMSFKKHLKTLLFKQAFDI